MTMSTPLSRRVMRGFGFSTGEVLTIAAVCVGIALIYAALVFLNNQYMAQYLETIQSSSSYSDNYDLIYQYVNNNEHVADLAVFAVWLVVGVCLYTLVSTLAIFERGVFRYFKILTYFKKESPRLIREGILHLVVRSASLVILIVGFVYFVKEIVPLILSNLDMYSKSDMTESIVGILVALVLLVVSIHVGVICLRGVALRERIVRTM